jgi:hypothetical protein
MVKGEKTDWKTMRSNRRTSQEVREVLRLHKLLPQETQSRLTVSSQLFRSIKAPEQERYDAIDRVSKWHYQETWLMALWAQDVQLLGWGRMLSAGERVVNLEVIVVNSLFSSWRQPTVQEK